MDCRAWGSSSSRVPIDFEETRGRRWAAWAAALKATPNKSNRQVAKAAAVHHETVAAVRGELEGRGEIRHVESVKDTMGRKQPTKKPKKPKPSKEESGPLAGETASQTAKESAEFEHAFLWRGGVVL
jgi:hypothetical protein